MSTTDKTRKSASPQSTLKKQLEHVVIPEGYKVSVRGVKTVETDTYISRTPFWKVGHVRDSEEKNWRIIVAGWNRNGELIKFELSPQEIHGRPSCIAARFEGEGLEIEIGQGKSIVEYLQAYREAPHLIGAECTGWHIHPQSRDVVFILPRRIIGQYSGDRYDLSRLQKSELSRGMTRRSTLAAWREEVAGLLRGNPVLMFSAMLGLSTPLLWLLDAEAGGIHLRGPSSTGKTTALLVAASVWGAPKIGGTDPSFVITWNTTANALEGVAASRCDISLVLDEVGEFEGWNFGRIIYALATGQGKTRMYADTTIRSAPRWRFNYLSTGEKSVAEMLRDDGPNKGAHAGQMVRLLNIETGNGIVTDAHDHASPEDFVNAVRKACCDHHGVAGRAFVEHLLGVGKEGDGVRLDKKALKELYDRMTRELTPDGMDGQQRRAIRRFALVAAAGHLAAEFKVLPFTQAEIMDSVASVIGMWLSNGPMSDAVRSAVRLRDYIENNLDNFADPSQDFPQIRHKAGLRRRIDGRDLFLFTSQTFKQACGAENTTEVCRFLLERGFLHCNNAPRYQSRFSPVRELLIDDGPESSSFRKGKVNMYAVEGTILSWDEEGPARTVRKAEPGDEERQAGVKKQKKA